MSERILSIKINGFPCPPSVNRMYSYPQGRVVKSKEYRTYEGAVYAWLVGNQEQIKAIRGFVKDIGYHVIHIDAVFHMLASSIICKNGKPKKNDTSNRLKALHDVLAKYIIGIDDSFFWSGSFSKVGIESDAESVDIVLKLRKIDEGEGC